MGELCAPKDPLVGQVVAGEFTVGESIGVGGMGAVYRATQTLTERPVALELLYRHLINEVMHKRFVQEARVVSRLNHPDIVVVYNYGQQIEFIQGRSCWASVSPAKATEKPPRWVWGWGRTRAWFR